MTNRRVTICQPTKNTMQSGRAKGKTAGKPWVLTYDLETPRAPENVMGWVASGDTLNQVTLNFPTSETAVAYAQAQGWDYDVLPARQRTLKGRTYLDNFLKPAQVAVTKVSQ
jgi:hypothetical protein